VAVGQAIGRCNEIPSRKITDDRRQMTVDRSQLKKGKKRTTVSSNTDRGFKKGGRGKRERYAQEEEEEEVEVASVQTGAERVARDTACEWSGRNWKKRS